MIATLRLTPFGGHPDRQAVRLSLERCFRSEGMAGGLAQKRRLGDVRDTGGYEPAEERSAEGGPARGCGAGCGAAVVKAARDRGEQITGPDGLLKIMTSRCWSPLSRRR